jgi:hypothetical protein
LEEKLKKIVLWLSVVFYAYAIPMAPGTIEKTHAGARGCCMQLAPDGVWYQNGMDFNQCRSANQSHDGNDDLYQPSGVFWWNVDC